MSNDDTSDNLRENSQQNTADFVMILTDQHRIDTWNPYTSPTPPPPHPAPPPPYCDYAWYISSINLNKKKDI